MPSSGVRPYWSSEVASLYLGDARTVMSKLPRRSVHCCVTSPPYWNQRDYGTDRQIGNESVPDCGTYGQKQCGDCFVCSMTSVFREVRRALRDDGTAWLNLGDKFDNGQLLIPSRVGLALRTDGWFLAQKIAWYAPNKMPEPTTKRCTRSYEEILLLAKSSDYYYDAVAVQEENQANKRDVWTYPVARYPGAHTATFSTELISPCILAGTSEHGCCSECETPYQRVISKTGGESKTRVGKERDRSFDWSRNGAADAGSTLDGTIPVKETIGWRKGCNCNSQKVKPCTVLDPFVGSGTTVRVSNELGRVGVGIDLSETYLRDCSIPRLCSPLSRVASQPTAVIREGTPPPVRRVEGRRK